MPAGGDPVARHPSPVAGTGMEDALVASPGAESGGLKCNRCWKQAEHVAHISRCSHYFCTLCSAAPSVAIRVMLPNSAAEVGHAPYLMGVR